MSQLTVVKVGGKVIDDEALLLNFLTQFAQLSGNKILVHGGGTKANQVLKQMGLKVTMLNGRRVTSKRDLEIVTAVYAGLINKSIIAKLQSINCNALGLCGADANSIVSTIRAKTPIDYGLVGDIATVNNPLITLLIANKIVPVFNAITHDKNGQLLNTNADSIASFIAGSLTTNFDIRLYYYFELAGVFHIDNNESKTFESLTASQYQKYKQSGDIKQGMVPKLDNAFLALKNGVKQVCIGNQLSDFKGTNILQ